MLPSTYHLLIFALHFLELAFGFPKQFRPHHYIDSSSRKSFANTERKPMRLSGPRRGFEIRCVWAAKLFAVLVLTSNPKVGLKTIDGSAPPAPIARSTRNECLR